MTEGIMTALITGSLTLIGVIISSKSTQNNIQKQLEIHQAVTDEKIDELTREVRKHNNFAERMPVVENELKHVGAELSRLGEYHK